MTNNARATCRKIELAAARGTPRIGEAEIEALRYEMRLAGYDGKCPDGSDPDEAVKAVQAFKRWDAGNGEPEPPAQPAPLRQSAQPDGQQSESPYAQLRESGEIRAAETPEQARQLAMHRAAQNAAQRQQQQSSPEAEIPGKVISDGASLEDLGVPAIVKTRLQEAGYESAGDLRAAIRAGHVLRDVRGVGYETEQKIRESLGMGTDVSHETEGAGEG